MCIIQERADWAGLDPLSLPSNRLLAQGPTFRPVRGTPRPQMICLLSANSHHNAFRGTLPVVFGGGRGLYGCHLSVSGLGSRLGGAGVQRDSWTPIRSRFT
jgi:hypothetical protein